MFGPPGSTTAELRDEDASRLVDLVYWVDPDLDVPFAGDDVGPAGAPFGCAPGSPWLPVARRHNSTRASARRTSSSRTSPAPGDIVASVRDSRRIFPLGASNTPVTDTCPSAPQSVRSHRAGSRRVGCRGLAGGGTTRFLIRMAAGANFDG